jgi:PAS domain S-box-containing protein
MNGARHKLSIDSVVVISGWGTTLLGLLGLISWLYGVTSIFSVKPDYISMSFDSAILFIVFGVLLLSGAFKQNLRINKLFTIAVVSTILIYGLLRFTEYFIDINVTFHDFLFPIHGKFITSLLKPSSPVTNLMFFLCGAALLLKIISKGKIKILNMVSGLGLVIGIAGFASALGYFYNTPLLNRGEMSSLSVISAVAFFLMGSGLVAIGGTRNILIRNFVGQSPSAMILRTIVPVIIAIILIQGFMDVTFFSNSVLNHTLLYISSIFFLIILTSVVIVKVSQIVFSNASKAEAERLQAEEKLKRSEENLRLLLNSAAEAIYGIDLNGNCTFCNPACLNLLGYNHPNELIGKNMHDKIHYMFSDKTFYPLEECHIFEAFRKGEGIHSDNEVLWRADNTCFFAEYWSYPQYSDGVIVGAVVTFLDITERKRMEEELKKSHKELEQKVAERTQELQKNYDILDNIYKLVPGVIYQYQLFPDDCSCYPYVSDSINDIFEITPEEVRNDASKVFSILHSDDRDFIVTTIRESAQTLQPLHVEYRVVLPKKGLRWCMSDARPKRQADGSTLWHGFISDITEHKVMQESLRKSEEWFRDMVENTIDWIWEIDENGVFTYTSPQVSYILGYLPDELKNKTLFDLMLPDESEKLKDFIIGKMQEKERIISLECVHVKKDGQQIVLERNAGPVYNPDCTLAGYRGIDRDITKRIKGQKELKASENKYRMLHETLRDGFVSTDMEGVINEINSPFLDMLGYDHKDEILSLNYTDLTPAKWYQLDLEMLNNQILKRGYSGNYEKELRRKDGTLIPVGLRTILLRDEEGNPTGMWSIVRDISERKKLQKLIIDATLETEEKERNRFSEDIHDGLGPLLSTINLYVNALLSPDYSEVQKHEMISNLPHITQQAIQTAREVARNLMPNVLQSYGLVKAIEAFCSDISKSCGIKINFDSANYKSGVAKNKEILTYRIINELINNTIKHAKATLVNVDIESNNDMLWLNYSDNGIGFKIEEVMKSESKGQGLQNIFNRVKTLEGVINYITEPGKGVNVTLSFSLHN